MPSDDEYGLEPAKKAGTAVAEDEYGLEKAAGSTSTFEEEPTEENLPGSTERLRSAVSSGVAKMQPPTKFEEANKMPEAYGFTPSNIASNLWRGGKEIVGATGQLGKDLLFSKGKDEQGKEQYGLGGIVGMSAKGGWDPSNRIDTLTQKYLTDPAVAEYDKAKEELEKGHTLGAVGHAGAAALPVFGSMAADFGEQAGTGDIGGTGARIAGQFAGGEMMMHPLETVKAPLKLADKVIRGTPLTEAGKLEAAKQQALAVKNPSMKETEYAQKVTDALPELQRIAQDNKGKIKTPRQATQAINERISQLEAPISEHIKGLTGENAIIHPDQYQSSVNSAIDAEFAKEPGLHKPAEIEKAKKAVDDFIGTEPKTIEQIENNRRRLNQDADAYYNSSTEGKRSIDVSDATAKAQRTAANAIRDVLYGDGTNPGALENAGVSAVDVNGKQVPIRELRRSVGKLLDIRDHFEDAITRAEKAGDWSLLNVMKSGPSLAMGGLGAGLGGIAGGVPGFIMGTLLGEGGKAWTDYLRSKNPNLNVQKMFRNLQATGKPNTVDVQTRAPIRQYTSPVGPQLPHSMEPAGPKMPPEPFELGAVQPRHDAGLWQQQAGALPDLTWGGPNPPYFEPAGPKEAPMEAPLPPIQGVQQSLPLPPENAPLFNIQQTPRVGEPPTPIAPPPEGGTLPPIGGPGREGVLGRIEPSGKGQGLLVPPEATKASAQPTPPPGPRWTPDRGAMPGEPELLLDMPEGGEPSEAKAAIIQREDPREPGRARWEVMDSKGESQGLFSTPEEAAAAAEKRFPAETQNAELSDYAKTVIRNGDVKEVKLVGSTATGKIGRDTDIVYDFGKIGLPETKADAEAKVEKLIESSKIDTEKYDSFIKADDRYFHISSGAGRSVVENTEYGKQQTNKPSITLAGGGESSATGLKIGAGENLGEGLGTEHIITKDGKRVGSISIEPKENGKTLHIHWLGGEFGRELKPLLMEEVERIYPDAEKFTYDRRRLAKGAEKATTEPREMKIKKMTKPRTT